MATVNGFTAEHMQAIEDATIVSGTIDSTGHLILTRHDGSTLDAGVTIASGNFASVAETFAGTEPLKAVSPASISQLTAGAALSSTQDLDLMIQNGQFHQGTQANAAVSKHYPMDNIGGMLIVQSQASLVSQLYVPRPGYPNVTCVMWQRAKFSTNAWSAWFPIAAEVGYRLLTTLYFTSSGTFTKASYPGLKAVKVKSVGGGGAGGGAPVATTAGNHSQGGGGGGGGYAESFLLDAVVASSVTVTIGAGGTAVSGAAGGNGGSSSFGTQVRADGGLGGTVVTNAVLMVGAPGGAAGAGFSGDFLATGSPGEMGTGNASLGIGGNGGNSVLGGGGIGVYTGAGAGSLPGNPGLNYGGGGGGAQGNSNAPVRAGGNGAPGVVIVEVYV